MALKPREEKKLRKLFGMWHVQEDEANEFIKQYYAELDKDDDGEVDEEELDQAEEQVQEEPIDEEPTEEVENDGEEQVDFEEKDEEVAEDAPVDDAPVEEPVQEEPIAEEPIAEEPVQEEPIEDEKAIEEEADAEKDALKAELESVRGELGDLKALFEELRQKVEGGSFGASSQLPPQDGDEEWVGAHTRAYFNR